MYGAAALIVAGCQREAEAPATTETQVATQDTTQDVPQDVPGAAVNTVIAFDQARRMTSAKLGTPGGDQGLVTVEKSEFKSGEPIVLTMWLEESPGGLVTSAQWIDPNGKEIASERKPMNGEKIATFALVGRKLGPGTYRVVGYWGGNIATEKEFEITR